MMENWSGLNWWTQYKHSRTSNIYSIKQDMQSPFAQEFVKFGMICFFTWARKQLSVSMYKIVQSQIQAQNVIQDIMVVWFTPRHIWKGTTVQDIKWTRQNSSLCIRHHHTVTVYGAHSVTLSIQAEWLRLRYGDSISASWDCHSKPDYAWMWLLRRKSPNTLVRLL